MDYKEKYEQALKTAKLLADNTDNEVYKKKIEAIFPELIESEDDRIRKEIIQFLQLPHPQFVGKRNHEEWIAWLEKQGEKPAWSKEDIMVIDCAVDFLNKNGLGSLAASLERIKSLADRIDWNPTEKQKEEALADAVKLYKSTHLDS